MWLKCVRHPKNAIFTQNFAMRKVWKCEKRNFSGVRGKKWVIYNVKEDSLGAMVEAVGILERMKEAVVWQVVVELLKDSFLKKLGNEWKVRDRAIVFQVIWVKVVLFQERTNNSCLKCCGKGTCAQGCVNNVHDSRKQVWKAVREERCRHRVKLTWFERHWFQCLILPFQRQNESKRAVFWWMVGQEGTAGEVSGQACHEYFEF